MAASRWRVCPPEISVSPRSACTCTRVPQLYPSRPSQSLSHSGRPSSRQSVSPPRAPLSQPMRSRNSAAAA